MSFFEEIIIALCMSHQTCLAQLFGLSWDEKAKSFQIPHGLPKWADDEFDLTDRIICSVCMFE